MYCLNGMGVFGLNASNVTTSPSQCATGFSTNGLCVTSSNAALNSLCVQSVVPNCNCVNGICTSFPLQVWVIAVLSSLGFLLLVLLVAVICLCRKVQSSDKDNADRLVYNQ